jgi:phenylacetate-CoA ligase
MILSRLMWNVYLAYHLRGQSGFPFKPLEEIKRTQAKRLQSMISHAYSTVPYYRETMKRLGLRPDDLRTPEDLERLPLLERDQLQRDPEYFLSRLKKPDSCLKLRSSGSTGNPRTIYHDAAALFQNAAHSAREHSIIGPILGKSIGYRASIITSPNSSAREVLSYTQKRGFFPSGIRIERQSLWLADPPEKNISLMDRFKPDILHTYGSYLEMLFPYLHATGRPFHKPKVVMYGADNLSDSVRRLIVEEFKIPVLSTYQAIEAFKIGFECNYNTGLHLNIDLYPIRIIDSNGQSLRDGESGDVVISNLVNRATVLLNYRLGDVASKLPTGCLCGRILPLLSFPQGRSNDWIELASGKIVHSQVVNAIFRGEEEVWQHQVLQQSRSQFQVSLVASKTSDRDAISGRITEKFVRNFGSEIELKIAFVEEIARTDSGKFRTVISNRCSITEDIFDNPDRSSSSLELSC